MSRPRANLAIAAFLRLGRRALSRSVEPAHDFTGHSFERLDPALKFEEEYMPGYEKGLFYPVQIGQVFSSRYQVLSKLGYGANSTVWFCRDLIKRRYAALKVYICSPGAEQECNVLRHLESLKSSHPGKEKFRTMLDAFTADGPSGRHQCLVHEPLLTSISHLQASLPNQRLTEQVLKLLLKELLVTLDYLHTEAQVIHTDIQSKNIMIGTNQPSLFERWKAQAVQGPTPRKNVPGHVVYRARRYNIEEGRGTWGLPLLSDFGQARIGPGDHEGVIQPTLYRAPEVVLGMKWDSEVDIWNLGALIWELFENYYMFQDRGPDGEYSEAHLLASMIALLGPPPSQFLKRSDKSLRFWDESGNWRGLAEIADVSFEESELYLEGRNKDIFIQFVRKMVRWEPNERQTARELLNDPWLLS
ncbi:serine/threonine-protein kinase [Trichophyton mentagrophytes]|uniref:non-specific serine/threonine protein kinase n=1 Tax=Trichophyton interdigitale (strain MR816) TaxID=1215338 RepID=A0A059J6G8_TRIIM|nr:CMGC/SRPK protein kinase [Trichophyton interdigitale H6]KDB23440.1 CMGC/SRPK protein kinase [Trichophyton interdigitale MR816]GBF63091.1 serine/threonine-protein kinase [Trichophyton mentagrophytes]